jgi:predicted  nucleic acid-binding Zn-ribbon protein
MAATSLLNSIDSLQKNLQDAQAKEASANKRVVQLQAELQKREDTNKALQEVLMRERAEIARLKAVNFRFEKENEDLRKVLSKKDQEVRGNSSVSDLQLSRRVLSCCSSLRSTMMSSA